MFGQCDCIKSIVVFCQSLQVRLFESGFINSSSCWGTQSVPRHRSKLCYDELWTTRQEVLCENIICNTWCCSARWPTTQVHNLLPPLSHRSGPELNGEEVWSAESKVGENGPKETNVSSQPPWFSVCVRPLIPVYSSKEKWKHVAKYKSQTVTDHPCYVNEQQLQLAG